MERPTEYEILSKELGIVDRDTFLSNLEKLALVNQNAMILLRKKNWRKEYRRYKSTRITFLIIWS